MSSPERILAVTLYYTDKTLFANYAKQSMTRAPVTQEFGRLYGKRWVSLPPYPSIQREFYLLPTTKTKSMQLSGFQLQCNQIQRLKLRPSTIFNSPSSLNNLESPLFGAMQDKIQQSKAKREADIRKERDQKRGLTKSLDVAKSQFKAEQERAAKLEATLKAASKSREKTKLESMMESKVAKAAQDASEAKRDMQALEKKLLAKFERVTDERDTAQERSEVLSKNLDTALEHIETLSKDLDTALERIDTLSKDLDTTRSQLALVLTWREDIINKLDPQRIASLEELSDAIVNAVLHQNFSPLYTLRLRAVLDHTQSLLEQSIPFPSRQVTDPENHTKYSNLWRQRLGSEVSGNKLSKRVTHARSLLANAPAELRNTISSDNAMAIVCQNPSPICIAGNKVAYSYGEAATDQKAIEHVLINPAERNGMAEILASLST
ncbi:hypothetical protein NLJ89_g7479 [Agrocybe chaxingu]|uniref:Uncharacterized protein n=1 Tax=Agrocybe chaxingu TaxID=84603 RepID=A0A9W8MV13_9AGAR|nr:hypothetical protein NLJ89_g7479 [Agrocybe chaxingu]